MSLVVKCHGLQASQKEVPEHTIVVAIRSIVAPRLAPMVSLIRRIRMHTNSSPSRNKKFRRLQPPPRLLPRTLAGVGATTVIPVLSMFDHTALLPPCHFSVSIPHVRQINPMPVDDAVIHTVKSRPLSTHVLQLCVPKYGRDGSIRWRWRVEIMGIDPIDLVHFGDHLPRRRGRTVVISNLELVTERASCTKGD